MNDLSDPQETQKPTTRGLRHATLAAKITRMGAVLILSLAVWGCASTSSLNDPEARAEQIEMNDPLEPVNRVVFEVNRGLDTWLLKPAAIFYGAMMPPEFQTAIGNFLGNLSSPLVLLNDLLQGEAGRAGNTVARFIINSTVGIAGLFDPATDMGYPDHSEDFGQTLAVWGVGEGPYIMLPIFGPSNPRDVVGLVADYFTDPVNQWSLNTNRDWVPTSRTGSSMVHWRATNMEEADDLERTSVDYYSAVRSLYRQHRRDLIRNGQPDSMPDISEMPSMDDPDEPETSTATRK